VEDENAYIIVTHNGDEFGLDFKENSIAPCFDLLKNQSNGKSEYKSEKSTHVLNQPYYLS
jgi:hypothetical protein